MHWMDLMVFSLLVGVPVIIVVEFFCVVANKRDKEKKASNARIKREIARRQHPTNGKP